MNDNDKDGVGGTKYLRLRDELLDLVEQGRVRAVAAANDVLVDCYWQIGKRLSLEKEIGESGSAGQLIERLAPDLGVGRSALYRAVQFFKTYPQGVPTGSELARLAWSWHLELLPVTDPGKRQEYARLAVDNSWTRKDLRQAIQNNLVKNVPERGKKDGARSLERPAPGKHTYEGVMERVVDGDTVIVRIDLGFDVWKSQRLRLRQVDAPELDKPGGEQAQQAVQKRLKIGQPVVLHTYSLDMYGRYVADLFFGKEIDLVSRKEMLEKGRFLNEELLSIGRWVELRGIEPRTS